MINQRVFLDLCSGVSLRRCALNLNVSYGTVYRRFLWLSEIAKTQHTEFLQNYQTTTAIYFDEMETLEHTKLKPLSIPLIVDGDQRILNIGACTIPAKGHLAEISMKKYGKRADNSKKLLQELFAELSPSLIPILIRSDGKPMYKGLVSERFPTSVHEIHVRKEEKKKEALFENKEKKKFDPMFALNQRCAKLRSDIKRLVRRSWCTTKKVDNLTRHLILYACYNNQIKVI